MNDVPEYLALTSTLRALCSEYDLEIVEKQNFQDFIFQMLPKFRTEFVNMSVPNNQGGLTEDEVEVAQMYCVLVLRRLRTEEDESRGLDAEEERVPLGKYQKDISQNDIVNLIWCVC